MKVGLLGGSFDPVHKGHLQLAREARRQLGLKKVYFVLSPRPPHKGTLTLTPVSARLKMLRAVLKKFPAFEPGLWELKRRGLSYTFQSLRDYKRDHPSHEIYFLMGSDSFSAFDSWKNPEIILRLATLVVGKRPGTRDIRIKRAYRDKVQLLRGSFPMISSRWIRAHFYRENKARRFLPSPVARWIAQNKLYE